LLLFGEPRPLAQFGQMNKSFCFSFQKEALASPAHTKCRQ
jgi:hypothetical protein